MSTIQLQQRASLVAALGLLVVGLSSTSYTPLMSNAQAESRVTNFELPQVGAPTRRVTGGTRSLDEEGTSLAVLSPEYTGFTLSKQPTLYWAVMNAPEATAEFSLIYTNPQTKSMMQAAVESQIPVPKSGIQALSLQDLGITLEQGTEYEWSITLVRDPQNRTRDLVTRGTIKRLSEQDKVKQVQALAPKAQVNFYKQNNAWYDALAVVSQQIKQHPNNPALREDRIALLEKVGLKQFTALDRLN
jgi:hypothetical protein